MSQETKGVKQGKRKKDMEKEHKEDGDVAFIPTGCYSMPTDVVFSFLFIAFSVCGSMR